MLSHFYFIFQECLHQSLNKPVCALATPDIVHVSFQYHSFCRAIARLDGVKLEEKHFHLLG